MNESLSSTVGRSEEKYTDESISHRQYCNSIYLLNLVSLPQQLICLVPLQVLRLVPLLLSAQRMSRMPLMVRASVTEQQRSCATTKKNAQKRHVLNKCPFVFNANKYQV